MPTLPHMALCVTELERLYSINATVCHCVTFIMKARRQRWLWPVRNESVVSEHNVTVWWLIGNAFMYFPRHFPKLLSKNLSDSTGRQHLRAANVPDVNEPNAEKMNAWNDASINFDLCSVSGFTIRMKWSLAHKWLNYQTVAGVLLWCQHVEPSYQRKQSVKLETLVVGQLQAGHTGSTCRCPGLKAAITNISPDHN